MSLRPWLLASMTSAGLFSLGLLQDQEAVPDHDETWMVQVRRARWAPRDVDYVLRLEAEGGSWSGEAAVDLVMPSQTVLPASEVELTDSTVEFTLQGPEGGDLRFSGLRSEGAMEGSVTWTDAYGNIQRDVFTAHRRTIPRFDLGRDLDGAVLAPEEAGLSPVLLDRLIYRAEKARSDALVVLSGGALVSERYFGQEAGLLPLGKRLSAGLSVLGEPRGLLAALDNPRANRNAAGAITALSARDLARAGQLFAARHRQRGIDLDEEDAWRLRYGGDGEVIGYSSSSNNGAHLLVYPEVDLVVARLISPRSASAFNLKHDKRDDFYALRRLSDRLAVERLRSR